MTIKDFAKVKKQLENKPMKWQKVLKHNKPKDRNYGRGVTKCKMCGSHRGHIKSYGLDICRRCFRLNATKMGFRKLD